MVRQTFSLLLVATLFSCTQTPTFDEDARLVADPYWLVWERFQGKRAGLIRFFADINGDKRKDLFVGAMSLQDSSGGSYQVFEWTRQGYRFLGTIDQLNPYLFEVLPTQNKKIATLKTVWPLSSESARSFLYRYNGKEFVLDLDKEVTGQFAEAIEALPIEPELSAREAPFQS